MRRPLALFLLAATVGLVPGCGSDPSPGEAEPRRALDPRAEAMRFFGANTRALLLLRTDMPRSSEELASVAGSVPTLARTLENIGARLKAAGIDSNAVLRLGRAEDGEGPGAELVVGLAPGARFLFVLATDRPDDLEELFASAAKTSGALREAGRYDDALLYAGPGVSFALRDGVLAAAASLATLRRAISIRDGDPSRHLDDDDIDAALDDVPRRAALHAVARRGDRFAAVAVRPVDGGAEVRVAADLPDRGGEEDEEPHPITVETATLMRLLESEAGIPPNVAAALSAIGPFEGAAYTDGDRLVAGFTVEGSPRATRPAP